MASINLRALIDNVLRDTSDDMREQCNAVNEAFAKRVEELNDAKSKLENHLQKVSFHIWIRKAFLILKIKSINFKSSLMVIVFALLRRNV